MASIKSLGIHTPSALPYLVAEGILPPDPPPSSYTWQQYPIQGDIDSCEEEELLITATAVAWSRGKNVLKLFRFDLEEEPVRQALFVCFTDDSVSRPVRPRPKAKPVDDINSPTLTIRKRPQPTTAQTQKSPRASAWVYAEHGGTAFPPSVEDDKRALVVLLKKQIQVIFLSGSTHLLPLPFPVAAVFALPSGLAVQREPPDEEPLDLSQPTPQAPYNSFAMSQLTTSMAMPSQSQDQEPPPAIRKMLANVFNTNHHFRSSLVPTHFYIRDPITEIEPLGESMQSQTDRVTDASSHSARKLDHNERLIYVSSKDELLPSGTAPRGTTPLLLAITVNAITGHYSVWKFSEERQKLSARRARESSATAAKDKIRASFGPGTGATTPVVRKSVGARESFGKLRESIYERSVIQDEADIASQLDPAFENPGAPSRSSRRISSLIARSETHGGRDNANVPDLTSSHSQVGGAKRGPSFGARSSRKSFSSLGHERPRTGTSSHTELGNVPDDDETMADSDDDTGGPALAEPSLASLTDTKRLVLSKVFSFRADSLRSKDRTYAELLAAHNIFTFAPTSIYQSGDDRSRVVLCIMSYLDNSFHVLDLTAARTRQASLTNSGIELRVNRATSSSHIQDACLIGDSTYSRIMILRREGHGTARISLQSPWNPTFHVNLPTKMFTAHPYQVEQEYAARKQRNGSFKRVLSGGPDEMHRLQYTPGSGQIGILGSEQVCHLVQIQLTPSHTHIKRAIQVCEAAIRSESEQNELMLRAWWDISTLLNSKLEKVEDSEWRAFVATIFSLYVPFLDNPKGSKPARTRRKGGLLRSSSGANVDLESFEESMVEECLPGGAVAPWLIEGTWSWVLEVDTAVRSTTPSQHKTRRSTSSFDGTSPTIIRKRTLLGECVELARAFHQSEAGTAAFGDSGYLPIAQHTAPEQKRNTLRNVFIALHLLREELKLDAMASSEVHAFTPVLAQIGTWLEWDTWACGPKSFYMLESAEMDRWIFDNSKMRASREVLKPFDPPSILQYVEDTCNGLLGQPFATLDDLSGQRRGPLAVVAAVKMLTPRTALLLELLQFQDSGPTSFIRIMGESDLTPQILETFPEGVAASLRSVIVSCQANPGASFPPRVLDLIDRPDLDLLQNWEVAPLRRARHVAHTQHEATRDYNTICRTTLEPEAQSGHEGSAEEDRSLVTKLLFSIDQRFGEAARILHPLKHAMAKCVPEPDWTDTELLEAQQDLAKIVASRTLSVSPGRAMLYYNARFPLLTEKFPIHGFSLSCLMRPTNTIVTADKNIYTEEKVSWAFFHAGVEAGLSISRGAKGIDTSWISFNKPVDLGNRHAGFLLALGLNGHLKSIAKWVAFKYLTPKHTMTSIGLLLGLAASYLGTMDTLITRLLSVHVTRMLPIGAAEMNLSPLTQTTGIMGIGLLYCNTQHRRMSEVMLSEIESTEQDDIINPLENLRDEGYRLAAGFALGYINVGQGRNLKGMRDMHIVERLLTLAVATKRVDLVHILDKATTAAVVAIALIFMKTEEWALAKKIDIPDTVHQFEYVRPDLFLLRTVARHLIMWKRITPTFAWIKEQLPPSFRDRHKLNRGVGLHSEQLPLFNIVAGLCLSIGLRFAGSAREDVRDILGHYLDCFMKIVSMVGGSYDEKLARIGARNCQDVVALAAASVMAGSGDVFLLKRFRVLHGRTDVETHYGSHLAAHQAIGVLFLGGGTHTFRTSNLAVASLLCAFYPLFPTSVLDNRCHLQAFRHFWVFAAEPRCLVARSVETRRPMSLDIIIALRSGEELHRTAPCLLPELDRIARITSNDPRFWPVSLDFANDPQHLAAFRQHQSLYVRRRSTYNQGLSVFSATMRALNERQMSFQRRQDAFEWLFALPSLATLDHAARTLVLPVEGGNIGGLSSLILGAGRTTAVDDRLALEHGCLVSGRAERLWSLRVLFAWEDKMRRVAADDIAWLGREVIAMLRAKVALLGRQGGG